jgi:hypothetical protein
VLLRLGEAVHATTDATWHFPFLTACCPDASERLTRSIVAPSGVACQESEPDVSERVRPLPDSTWSACKRPDSTSVHERPNAENEHDIDNERRTEYEGDPAPTKIGHFLL